MNDSRKLKMDLQKVINFCLKTNVPKYQSVLHKLIILASIQIESNSSVSKLALGENILSRFDQRIKIVLLCKNLNPSYSSSKNCF